MNSYSRCKCYYGICKSAVIDFVKPPVLHGVRYSSNAKVMINTNGDFSKFVFGKTGVKTEDEASLAPKPVKNESEFTGLTRNVNRGTPKFTLGLLHKKLPDERKQVIAAEKKSQCKAAVTLDTDSGIARFFFAQPDVEGSSKAKREVGKDARKGENVRMARTIYQRAVAKSRNGACNRLADRTEMTLDTDLGVARFSFGEQKVNPTSVERSSIDPSREYRMAVDVDCRNANSSYIQPKARRMYKVRQKEPVFKCKRGVLAGEAKKLSKKAKINELRWFRLKARKKMKSPNPEVRIRYKLEKAKRKEEWLIEKLKKFYVPYIPAPVHDPEILTREEKFYIKRTGEKKKHYVEVGRRGVIGGVVLNMHLHWKRHETVKVICKPCKTGQVHEYAEEISRLSKGIVIDIKNNNTILFYRGKNYIQPDVMLPTNTLSKPKALEKYKFEQSLEHTGLYIERLEKELDEYLKHVAAFKKKPGEESMKKNADKECIGS